MMAHSMICEELTTWQGLEQTELILLKTKLDHAPTFIPNHIMVVAAGYGLLEWAQDIYHQWCRDDKKHLLNHFRWRERIMKVAIIVGHTDFVSWLLEHGYDINMSLTHRGRSKDNRDIPLVLTACTRKQFEMASLLIQRGASLFGSMLHFFELQKLRRDGHALPQAILHLIVTSYFGAANTQLAQGITQDLLELAIDICDDTLLKLLLLSRASTNPRSRLYFLSLALKSGLNDGIIRLLVSDIENKDTGNHPNYYGSHAAKVAAKVGHLSALRLTLSNKEALSRIKHDHGVCIKSAILCCPPDRLRVVAELIESGASTCWTLHAALHMRDYGMLMLLLVNGVQYCGECDARAKDSLLCYAILGQDMRAFSILVTPIAETPLRPEVRTFIGKYNLEDGMPSHDIFEGHLQTMMPIIKATWNHLLALKVDDMVGEFPPGARVYSYNMDKGRICTAAQTLENVLIGFNLDGPTESETQGYYQRAEGDTGEGMWEVDPDVSCVVAIHKPWSHVEDLVLKTSNLTRADLKEILEDTHRSANLRRHVYVRSINCFCNIDS